jgi:hypothetical protein
MNFIYRTSLAKGVEILSGNPDIRDSMLFKDFHKTFWSVEVAQRIVVDIVLGLKIDNTGDSLPFEFINMFHFSWAASKPWMSETVLQ